MLGLEIIKSTYVPRTIKIDSGWWKTLFRFHYIPFMIVVNGKLIVHPATYELLRNKI